MLQMGAFRGICALKAEQPTAINPTLAGQKSIVRMTTDGKSVVIAIYSLLDSWM